MTFNRWWGLSFTILFLAAGAVWWYLAAGRSDKRPAQSGFRDRARESGIDFQMSFLPGEQGKNFKINFYDHGAGVVIGDFDSDGYDDVYFLNQLGSNVIYRNRGDGTFTDVTREAGDVGMQDRICVGGACADYDNDGDQDLFVTSTRGGNELLRNEGNCRFEKATAAAGVECIAHSQTPGFFDADGDGDLDLFVTNSAEWTLDEFNETHRYFVGPQFLWSQVSGPEHYEFNILYRNLGNGTFTNATAEAGLRGRGWGGDMAAFDYDEDGDLDLFVTNMFGASQLFANDGRGRFTDVTRKVLGVTSFGAIGSKAFDYTNDGRLDLFVADMHSDMWMKELAPVPLDDFNPRKKYEHMSGPKAEGDLSVSIAEDEFMEQLGVEYSQVMFGNALFKNRGGGRFQETSDRSGMETFWPWGVATGDFNNDGHEDVFIPSGMGYPFQYWPNALMMNNGDGTFTDRAADAGIEPPRNGINLREKIDGKPAPRSSRCAATADFDGDGRLDIMVNNFNDRPYYFRNGFPRRNYIAFRLTGKQSNRDAIGAVVKLHFASEVMVRQVHAAGGYLSQSSKTLHFGLGDRQRIDRVEIRWPSGQKQLLTDVKINRRHDVDEPMATKAED